MRSIKTVLLPALAMLAGCVNGFGYWFGGGPYCSEFDCQWQADQGAIEEVSTWHEKAKAYRLTGTPARVSRKLDVAVFPDCVEMDITASVASDAQLELQFDFGDDGSIDVRVPAEAGDWTRRRYYVRTPSSARHLRTYIAKQGPGEAAIDYVELADGGSACASLPATTLVDGSTCLDDASCTSGYCVLGKCSACGAGGCAEGSACRADKDCLGGACAAGVCRACAANGSCGKDEGCSADNQCAAGTCAFGIKPSLVRYPEQDGVCGECNGDDDCAGRKCVLGQCGDCATDADCGAGLRCRYADAFEATTRSCVPRFDAILPRGALCEVDAECTAGLLCGGPVGRAKRCGVACRTSAECGAEQVCGDAGSAPSPQASVYELLPSFGKESNSRVRTCYPKIAPGVSGTTACQVHAQCPVDDYYPGPPAPGLCCGTCGAGGLDLSTGQCDRYSGYIFTRF